PAYAEKPAARDHAESARMLEAFDAKRLPLFVAYYRRRLPRFLKAKELIDAGRLGRVTGVVYRHTRLYRPGFDPQWRLDPAGAGGGLFLDLASHTLDLFDYLLGPLENVGGSAANFTDNPVEDAVAMHFTTGCGAGGA